MASVPGSVYSRYKTEEVLEMLDLDEPMREDSDDDLGLDLSNSDDEER